MGKVLCTTKQNFSYIISIHTFPYIGKILRTPRKIPPIYLGKDCVYPHTSWNSGFPIYIGGILRTPPQKLYGNWFLNSVKLYHLYTLFVHAHNIPNFLGIRKITDTYCTLGTYTNRACLFHTNERECGSEVWLLLWANRCLVKLYIVRCLCCKGWSCSRRSHYKLCTKRDKYVL